MRKLLSKTVLVSRYMAVVLALMASFSTAVLADPPVQTNGGTVGSNHGGK